MSKYEGNYSDYHDWKEWSGDTFGGGTSELHSVYSHLILKYAKKEEGNAIDFGFGNGEMLKTLTCLGFNSVGVEENDYLVSMALMKGFKAAKTLDDEIIPKSGAVAIITAFHVLEHLDKTSLQYTINKFADLLEVNGMVLAAFPNGDSPFSASAFNGDITHQTWIGSSMAEQIAKSAGLKLIRFEAFPSLARHSTNPLVRFRAFLRRAVEGLLNRFFSAIYYGSERKELSPVVVAVWVKVAPNVMADDGDQRINKA